MQLLTAEEAAAKLGITVESLRLAVHRKRLKPIKTGLERSTRNVLLFDPAEVERYAVEAKRGRPKGDTPKK